jgi:hypothetical protein
MNAVPGPLAFLIGGLVGALVYPPTRRWLATLVRTIQEAQQASQGAARRSGKLLAIFITMHPAPWLILLGIPYALYRAWTDPLRAMWLCLLAGAILVPAVMGIAEARRAGRAMPPGDAADL